VLWLTVAATASTVVLGLAVATLIVGRLTRPVRSLVTAMRDVQQGNLDVALPIVSEDEVGALTHSFNFFVGELRSKEQIKRTFGKYIDRRVLEHVVLQPGGGNDAGARRVMTVLFADLVGFTTLSERLTPTLLVTVLNRHFGLQAQAVHEHLGVVDKFLGDSIMAFWGPPFHQPEEHAAFACRAAVAQLAALETLRQELPELTGLRKETPSLDLRVGLCTGDVIVGNIGSENTRAFTVIGDTVNLTSRLEGANRIYDTRVLVGETTAQAAGAGFEFREVDSLAVKGKTEATRVFELLGEAGRVAEETLRLRDTYAEALRDYRAGQWDVAAAAFGRCLTIHPADGPSALLLKRIETLRTAPPPPDWDGAWRLNEK
jgi:adenylate cyclase